MIRARARPFRLPARSVGQANLLLGKKVLLGKARRAVYHVNSVYVVFSNGFVGVLLDLLGNCGNCKIGGGSWIRGIQIGG